ncbi:retinol dehydrogenase 13-like [Diabrotica virgifera virgifera]|uniref:NADP-retinol dehydrogenase n=1 Tax=Diabrotica virgifera virgifera TaxID=50390 RepID=A0A6P7GBT4_DIAVI|nr:retinol dehydrogenase 13-like [Diabrotica virgifera virgifera]
MIIKSISKKIPTTVVVGSALAGGFGLACLIKEYVGGFKYQGRDTSDAEGKVIIITGANTGIGKETAWELARRNAKVYMACRDMARCEAAREEIVLDTKNKYVYCRSCDLASLESIREFVKNFKSKEQKLDVLINNAGVMRTPNSKTKDGFEMQLGVNHMGHFLLTNLLLDMLKQSAPSRIINVSSVAHKRGEINKEDLNSDKSYDPSNAYAQSKLANILFTNELAKRLEGTGVTANSVHPGIVDTELTRHMSFFSSWISSILLKPLMWPFIKSPKQGAQTPIYLAIDTRLAKTTGKYFSNYEETSTSEKAKDEATARWLWLTSEKWTRL